MRLSNRDGFALPIAIGSMVVIGMLIAGVFFAATQENRVGRNTLNQEKAFRAAELGLNHVYTTWQNSVMNQLANGGTRTVTYDSNSTKRWRAKVRVTRLNDNTYLLVSTAFVDSGTTQEARHRTAAVVRIGYPSINFLGALTVRGEIDLGGSSFTTGTDTPPTGWTACPPGGPTQPGIATGDINNIQTHGCNQLNCVEGNPQIIVTPAAADTTTYFNYGPDADWATLTAAAGITFNGNQTLNGLGPTLASGACNTSDPLNWGDPNRATPPGPCESYFPIVYFADPSATAHITTGRGQGILLVDGDLLVDGGFEWFGPVIVRGHLTTQGTGGHFNGAVMAADVNLEQNTVLGNAIITYSSCANSSALVGAGIAKRLKQRAWADMF